MRTAEANRGPWFWTSVGAALIGLVDSLYLTWYKIGGAVPLCEGFGDCDAVNNSRFAEIGGIPIALLGAGAYLAILALHGAEWKRMLDGETANLGVFGLGLAGTLYSAYLTYVELFVLRAVCPFCVLSAVAITVIFVASIARMLNDEQRDDLQLVQES